ncbi:hypothetical protein F5887DRAFT_968850 [Amanita rubescens]|nr:hypothetical protein F5887DRAFT_968850 [Amanita rubescens]
MSRPDTGSTVIHQTVRIDESSPAQCASSASSITSEKNRNRRNAAASVDDNDKEEGWIKNLALFNRPQWKVPQALQWIPANFTWEKLKPVIRCALAGWISVVVFVIPKSNAYMGQVSCPIVPAIFSPPVDPFMSVLERELLLLLLSCVAWAWCCLGMFFANLARHNKAVVPLADAVTGKYLETGPTVILSVWIFLGCAGFLYIRASKGPSPYLFPSVLACIAVGKATLIPLSFHSVIALFCSIFVFPRSISSQYLKRLQNALSPLASALALHQSILKTPHDAPEFTSLYAQMSTMNGKAEDALVLLRASARLLKSDLVYSRFAPNDFVFIHEHLARLIGRTMGLTMFFSFMDPTREKFSRTPVPSLPVSPDFSRAPSRQHSPERSNVVEEMFEAPGYQGPTKRRKPHYPSEPSSRIQTAATSPAPSRHDLHSHTHHGHSHHHHHSQSRHLHHKLRHLKGSSRHEHTVAMFETQKYLNLEAAHLHIPYADDYTRQALNLIQDSCGELLSACNESIVTLGTWFGGVLDGRFKFWVSEEGKRQELRLELENFTIEKRHLILEPYKQAFESSYLTDDTEDEIPPHRYLFYCYVFQYHIMRFGQISLQILDNIVGLEEKRQSETIWTPAQHLFGWNAKKSVSDDTEQDFEEDPDHVEGIEEDEDTIPQKRDPDALPPSNFLERISDLVYQVGRAVFNGNMLYAIKAGLLTWSLLLFFPYFFKSSAEFAFRERFIWAIFMGQLTLSRFRGDTTFVFISRIIATFSGGVLGMVIWYIAAGKHGRGDPYGLAAVFAVCFPLIFYAMQYWPIPPLTLIISFITATLVVGFSYQDARQPPALNSAGVGFTVAWRRFLLVTVGVTIAFFVSYLPPSTTIRKYHRKLLATTTSELGAIYCEVISFANSRRQTELPEIITNLLAIRRKLKKAQATRRNARYEFSFRGKWPEKRYFAILDIQLQVAFAISHLVSIVQNLDPSWSRAFLRRTRFNDANFQGDILAVITMISTALRTGHPLPQITPCPLLDRFMLRFQGLEVIRKEYQDDYGLPQQMTLDTLKMSNTCYLLCRTFCVGVSTAFSIMTRLDRLMMATKEVVGEQYYIHGMGLGHHRGVEMGDRTESIQLRGLAIV